MNNNETYSPTDLIYLQSQIDWVLVSFILKEVEAVEKKFFKIEDET